MAKRRVRYFAEQLILKITLAYSDPPIWRRVEVHSGLTLHDLHFVIQNIFEWQNCHLYQFLAPPGGKLTQRAMREAVYYHVNPYDPIFEEIARNDRCADTALIGNIFTKDCKQIIYEYDFGDSWEHIVKCEKRTAGGDQDHVPVCLAGENAAPFDDMGGIPGYYMWLDALRDKSSDMHDDAIEVLGGDFDVTKFELSLANMRLKKCFKPPSKMTRKSRVLFG